MRKIKSPVTGRSIKTVGLTYRNIQGDNYNIICNYIKNKLDENSEEISDVSIDNFCKKIKRMIDNLIKAILELKDGGLLILGDSSHGTSLEEFLLDSFFYELVEQNEYLKKIITSSIIFTEQLDQTEKLRKNDIGFNFIGLDNECNIEYGSTHSSKIKKRNIKSHIEWSKVIKDRMDKTRLNIVCVGRSHIYNTLNIRKNGDKIYSESLERFFEGIKTKVYVLSNTNTNSKDNYDNEEIKGIENKVIDNVFFLTENSIIDSSDMENSNSNSTSNSLRRSSRIKRS